MTTPSKPTDLWTPDDAPTVEEDGLAPFRYWVESDSDIERRYLCDITANDGLGRCSCVDFQMVCEPNQRRLGFRIPYAKGRTGRTDCRHLNASRAYFFEHVTRPMLAGFKNGISQPSPQTNQEP